MNLTKLFEMQSALDNRIVKEKGLEGKDMLPQKILALQVELGECANEWRGFKFWSKRQSPKMFPLERCSYCGEEVSYTRPSPFMADFDADMCEECWNMTKEEYAASNGEYIPDFKDYPHFPEKKPQLLLEEYIDCIHFILSIGIQTGYEPTDLTPKRAESGGILQQFLSLNKHVGAMDFAYQVDCAGGFETHNFEDKYEFSLRLILGLGEMLGFTWEQIESAYMAKNAINHNRQSTGY